MVSIKSKQYRFWTNQDEIELSKFLDAQQNFTQFVKKLLNDYRLGGLTREDENDLKRKKLQVDIRLKEVMIKLKEKELLYGETFHQTPSSSAKRAMKIGVENQIAETPSCFDEKNNRIMCPECGSCFVFAENQKDIPEAKELFIDHYIQKHGMKFPPQLEMELKSF